MNQLAGFLLIILLVGTSGCTQQNLRGKMSSSEDGKTYLIVGGDSGGSCGPIKVDGEAWTHKINEAGEISPGTHVISCGAEIQFEIPMGVVFTFDYWGP